MVNTVLKINEKGQLVLNNGENAFPDNIEIKHYTIEGEVNPENYCGVHDIARGIDIAEASSRMSRQVNEIREFTEENDLLDNYKNFLDALDDRISQVPAMVREVFNNETPEEVEMSPIAMSYLKNSALARDVLAVNLTTGIYKGSSADAEALEVVSDIVNEILNDIYFAREDVGMNDCYDDEEDYDDDYDDYDDYDEYGYYEEDFDYYDDEDYEDYDDWGEPLSFDDEAAERDESVEKDSSSSSSEDHFPNIVSIPLNVLGLNKENEKNDSSQKKSDSNSSKEADLEDIINFISYLFK